MKRLATGDRCRKYMLVSPRDVTLFQLKSMDSSHAVVQFSALANEVRFNVFRILAEAGEEGMSAGDIARDISVSPSTLSPHLAQLERSGLIWSRRDGTRILYAVNPDGVSDLIDHIISDCCGGRPELCGGISLTASSTSSACKVGTD